MSTPQICVLDYGSGNVQSVLNLLASVAKNVQVSNDAAVIRNSSHIVLPGVGSFGAAMEKLKNRVPLDILENEVLDRKRPFLGICVGMQVLAEKGYEFGEHGGLGWISGVVDKLNAKELPVPHIGWNDIRARRADPLLGRLGEHQDFYFVHSFVFRPARTENVLATTDYGEEFCSIIKKDNIYGVQFHPEKSQKAGKLLMNNFLGLS